MAAATYTQSTALPEIATVLVRTPELQLATQKVYSVEKGCSSMSRREFPAPSPNFSNIVIQCNPPNRGYGISRNVIKSVGITAVITGTSPTGSTQLLNGGSNGPRVFPLSSITNNEQIQMNTYTIAQGPPMYQTQTPIATWYANCNCTRNGPNSTFPSLPDQSQNYSDLSGSNLNPLLGYQQSSGNVYGRNSFGYNVLTNSPTGATVSFEWQEPVIQSPWTYGEEFESEPSIIGVDTMQYAISFVNPGRLLSLVQDQGVTGAQILTSTMTLNYFNVSFRFFELDSTQEIPRACILPYYVLDDQTTEYNQTVPPGGLINLQSQNIQSKGIPQRIWVWMGQNTQTIATDTLGLLTDSTMSIGPGNPISLRWGTRTFLSDMGPKDIYLMSKSCGYEGTFKQFYGKVVRQSPLLIDGGFCGSMVCIPFGSTFVGLADDEAPGVDGSYNLVINISMLNTNASNSIVNPLLHVVLEYPGYLIIKDGLCIPQNNTLSRADVLAAKKMPNMIVHKSKNIYGGNFAGVANLLSRVYGKLKEAHDYVKENKLISRGADTVHEFAKAHGYGCEAGALLGGRNLGGRLVGGSQQQPQLQQPQHNNQVARPAKRYIQEIKQCDTCGHPDCDGDCQ